MQTLGINKLNSYTDIFIRIIFVMDKILNEYLEIVKENGYAKIDEFIDSDNCKNLEKQILKAFKKAKKEYFHTDTDFVKVLSVRKEDAENIKYFKFLISFFDNKNINEFIEKYFDSKDIEITKIFLAESSSTGEEIDVLPYKMHFDKTRYLKFMIYLRDVQDGDGGITFARKEWNTKLQEELLAREALQEENVVEINDFSQVDEIKGAMGTGVIFDTNVTHKAGQVLGENKRLVLRIDSRAKQ